MQTVLILILGLGVWEGAADLSKYSQEYDDYDAEDNDVSYDTSDDGRGQANDALDNPKEPFKPSGGIDFTGCSVDPSSGMCCVLKEEQMTTLEKDPILECRHTTVQRCHYTYVTQFKPAQQEECQENFEKSCQITFRQEAVTETVRKCYRPLEKVCNGQGPQQCRTQYESACSTKYRAQPAGGFVGDTACEKLPVEICGAGCTTKQGPEECHDKQVDSLVDVPEESCDLNPQKTCRLVTRLVPKLEPKQECTSIPKEVCSLRFTQPRQQKKPLRTEWCLDEETSPVQPSYVPQRL